jgi:hypothetical protein
MTKNFSNIDSVEEKRSQSFNREKKRRRTLLFPCKECHVVGGNFCLLGDQYGQSQQEQERQGSSKICVNYIKLIAAKAL